MNEVMTSSRAELIEAKDLEVVPGAKVSNFLAYVDRARTTADSYRRNLSQFCAWMAYAGVDRPVRADVIEYRGWLQTSHQAIRYDGAGGWLYRLDKAGRPYMVRCNDSTARQYLQALHRFFVWTSAEGLYPDITAGVNFPRINTDIHRREALPAEAVMQVEAEIRESAAHKTAEAVTADKDAAGRTQRVTEQGRRLRAMYLLAVVCGLRTCEISRANVGDIERTGGSAWLFVRGKGYSGGGAEGGGISGKTPLAPEVYQAIRMYLDERSAPAGPSDPLFTSTGNRTGSDGRRIAPGTIGKMLKAAIVEAGYDSPRITAHSLRHTAGQAACDVSGELLKAQHYLRHASPRTTEIYLNRDYSRQDAQIADDVIEFYREAAM